MASLTLKASTPTRVERDITSFTPSTLPPSTSTSSLTTLLLTMKTFLLSSAIPNTTLYEETSTNSTISSSLLEEEGRLYIDKLKKDATRILLPAVVFVAILSVVGLFGNSIVLLVYSKKAHRTVNDIFLMAIAAFDLLASVVSMPGEIYEMLHWMDFDILTACHFSIYFRTLTTWIPAIILITMAYTRYRKICKPFQKQISRRAAMIIITVIVLGCSLFAIPFCIFYGIRKTPTPIPGVFVKQCYVVKKYMVTNWPMVYGGVISLVGFISCIALIVFCVLIGLEAWRHRKFRDTAIMPKHSIASDHTKSRTKRISKAWNCCRRKKKCDLTPEDSSSDNDNGSKEKAEIKRNPTNGHNDEKGFVNETAVHCTKMLCSPMKDRSHVDIPMVRLVSVKLNKIRDDEIHTDEDKDMNDATDKPKPEVSSPMSPLSKCSKDLQNPHSSKKDTEYCQNKNATIKQMSDFPISMELVDVTYCLNEDAKTEDLNDVTHGASQKMKSKFLRASLQSSLQQNLADTWTRVNKDKKESVALKEIENIPNTAASSDTDGCYGKYHITFDETVIETNAAVERSRKLKRYNPTAQNIPCDGTLKTKSLKTKSNPPRRALSTTSLKLIIICVVYVIAYVIHIALFAISFKEQTFLKNMTDVSHGTFQFFWKFYYINNAANAIIYSLCDARFREQVQKIIKCRN